MSLPNGGFPPVKYCKSKKDKPKKKANIFLSLKIFKKSLI